MNTRQRSVLIVGITIVAWLLHILFLDWSFSARQNSLYTIFQLGEGGRGFGLMLETASDRNAGVLFGLVLPPSLIVWSVFLFAGLRDHRRRELGLAPTVAMACVSTTPGDAVSAAGDVTSDRIRRLVPACRPARSPSRITNPAKVPVPVQPAATT